MKSKNTKVLVVAGIVLALVLAGCSSLGYFGWQYLKNNTAVLAGQPSEEAGAEEATAPAEPVDNGEATEIAASNMMSYEDYVAGAPEGFSVVEIEGTYTYALNVSIKNGQRIYKWYEAFPATNHDANGYQYASGYATGDFVPASEVMSHWTQVTIITAEPTLIQP